MNAEKRYATQEERMSGLHGWCRLCGALLPHPTRFVCMDGPCLAPTAVPQGITTDTED